MSLRFTKMHGLGNDFVIVAAPPAADWPDAGTVRALGDRHVGIGFDQLLLLTPPVTPDSLTGFRIFNADGGEVAQCGNGARCVARFAAERAGVTGEFTIDAPTGPVRARWDGGERLTLEIGVPSFEPEAVPFAAAGPADAHRLEVDGRELELGVVSVGNPHAVLRVDSVDAAPVGILGPALEHHPRFPERANVGFLEVLGPERIRLRVHERGVGETRACGSGASAAVAVGRRRGWLASAVDVELPGGRLTVEWQGPAEPLWLTGEAVRVFEGRLVR